MEFRSDGERHSSENPDMAVHIFASSRNSESLALTSELRQVAVGGEQLLY